MDYLQACSSNTILEEHFTSYTENLQEESALKCL